MRNHNIQPSNIVKGYWNGGLNRGINISIVKEKKIDILTNYTTSNNNNAQEAQVLKKNPR